VDDGVTASAPAWAGVIGHGGGPTNGAGPLDDPYRDVPPIGEIPYGDIDDEVDTWAPIDLAPYLTGQVQRPAPTVGLARSDGLRLFYPGKEHAISGETESGKSMLAIAAVAVELLAGRRVVYLHAEESDPLDTLERLLALGVRSQAILAHFTFAGPEQPATPARIARLLDPPPHLVVIDGVNELMSVNRMAIREEDGPAAFRTRIVKPFTRAGAAVVQLDHVTKDAERRGRYSIGSVHKINGLTGAAFMLENAEPFGRTRRGASHVFVVKDRPGHLRRHGRPTKEAGKTYLGTFVVDATQERSPNLVMKLYAPADEDGGPAAQTTATVDELDAHVLAVVGEITACGNAATVGKVRALAKFRASSVDGALERLVVADRLVESQGSRGARVFTPTLSQDQEESDAS
jgi:hypothetical protein